MQRRIASLFRPVEVQSVPSRRAFTRPAFTLVELLVAIGIIALLLAILMPTVGRARESARALSCLSNVRQLGQATMNYVTNNEGWFPTFAARRPVALAPSNWLYWRDPPYDDLSKSAIARYVGSGSLADLLMCPSDTGERYSGFTPTYKFSYVLNCFISGWFPSGANVTKTVNINSVKRPTEKILIVEEDERSLNDGGFWGRGDYLSIRHDRQRVNPDTFQVANMDRRGNASFCDGHAEYITRGYAHDPLNYEHDK